jgi:hypothetical protein
VPNKHNSDGDGMVTRNFLRTVCILLTLAEFGFCGTFAAQGVAIWDQLGTKKSLSSPLISPNGEVSVRVTLKGDIESRRLALTICRHGQCNEVSVANGVGAELLWSPDSHRFALTWSDGGRLGGYSTTIFTIEEKGVTELPVSSLVRKAFGHPVKCEIPESPNVVPVTWISNDHILVAAQIVAHTICDSAGTFKAYEIDIDGDKVVKSFDQIEAKKMYGSYLGPALLSARDRCITHPTDCELPQNHKTSARG